MTREIQIEQIQAIDKKMLDIMNSKGSDYATEDVLSNFKRISQCAKILGINISTPDGYAMFMVLLKIDRITNLVGSGKTPSNESVGDSYLDGINYLKLSYLCYIESNIPPNDELPY